MKDFTDKYIQELISLILLKVKLFIQKYSENIDFSNGMMEYEEFLIKDSYSKKDIYNILDKISKYSKKYISENSVTKRTEDFIIRIIYINDINIYGEKSGIYRHIENIMTQKNIDIYYNFGDFRLEDISETYKDVEYLSADLYIKYIQNKITDTHVVSVCDNIFNILKYKKTDYKF